MSTAATATRRIGDWATAFRRASSRLASHAAASPAHRAKAMKTRARDLALRDEASPGRRGPGGLTDGAGSGKLAAMIESFLLRNAAHGDLRVGADGASRPRH